jgi:hypothetical protein
MSASSTSVFDAVALQLLEALQRYEETIAGMLGSWPELERYRESTESIERIRMYSSSLPQVRAQCVELLIAHAELVHFLWRAQRSGSREDIDSVRARHGHAVTMLRERCVRVVTHPAPKLPTAIPPAG